MSEENRPEDSQRNFRTAYTDKRKIPTISKYREEQQLRQERAQAFEDRQGDENGDDAVSLQSARFGADEQQQSTQDRPTSNDQGGKDEEGPKDTSEASAGATDPKQRRKENKKHRDEAAEREVTDPVTHLPVRIRDYTNDALQEVPENQDHYGSTKRTATGLSNKNKSSKDLDDERSHLRKERESIQSLFPPPDFNAVKEELASIHKLALTVGLAGTLAAVVLVVAVDRLLGSGVVHRHAPHQAQSGWALSILKWLILGGVSAGAVTALLLGVRDWMTKRVDAVWENEVWEANRQELQPNDKSNRDAESVVWLNSLFAAVWPLVNPDLFTSLADTLEDVMQASLPKMVRMVSVDDIGQGSESIQILGIKWLPTGAAAQSVSEDGDLKGGANRGNDNSGEKRGEDASERNEETQHSKDDDQQEDGTQQPVAQGLEAEEGDFVNIEVAFAYRARAKGKALKERSKDAHIFLAFYLPGNLKVPVWVELRGVVGSMRMRLQLCPDPPFFAICTLTFLGQPKVDMSCVPLSKYAVNIMDVPLISNFVQSAVDAAMAEYVAPKSLTLDLKDMLAGDDFKKDTSSHGVLVVNIKRGYEFTAGDSAIPLIKDGSSDPYVSVGWAKFGKPVWSTRLLMDEMEPWWDETCYVLVGEQELNVSERIRVQLWDSDRMSADDDLGRIEVDLKELMHNEKSNCKMWHRCDGFRALKAGEDMPGKLEWSVGYYSKARIQSCQLEKQSYDPEVRSVEQLKKKVDEICERKLREANIKEGRHEEETQELHQQKVQEFKNREDAMIISAPPPEGYPSGIFSIQIHQITGLELGKLSKDKSNADAEASDEEEQGEGLPSAYCNVIINHKKVFKTRTKPTNAKPFYNAGTERYIADWRHAEVHVSVRDARVKEEDPLLGIVHLPLAQIFKDRAQVNGFYPLAGGVGYGRVRISMVWRSIQLQAPPRALGWEVGTLAIQPTIKPSNDLPEELKKLKLKFHAPLGKGKMYPPSSHPHAHAHSSSGDPQSGWTTRDKKSPLKIGIRMRYSSPLTIAFESPTLIGKDKVPAFAVLWLKNIPDETPQTLTLPVFKGDFDRATKCCLPDGECGERVGSIEMEVKFSAGLGSAHRKWAKKDRNVRNVVEVLKTARDNLEEHKQESKAGIVEGSDDNDDDGESDLDSSDDDKDVHGNHKDPNHNHNANANHSHKHSEDFGDDTNDESDNESGITKPFNSLKKSASDFKKRQGSLGRRHRGIMQWRLPRTGKWALGKAHDVEGKFTGMFKHGVHGGRGEGVETEV